MKKKSKKKSKQKKINFIDVFTSHPELFKVPFFLEDIITSLWEEEENEVKLHAGFELEEYLDDRSDFIAIQDDDGIPYYHIPTFFEGKEFSVKPTKDEIDEGILYPGHRFIPYISEDIHASDIRLFDEDSLIPTTIVTKQLDELILYHSLLGMEGMVQYLIMDDLDNMPDLQIPLMQNSEFNVTVMEMKDYYKKHNFKPGDTILMKIDIFDDGELSMRYHSAKKAQDDKGKILKWCGLFSDGLDKAIEDNGPEMTIYKELTTAIMLHHDSLLSNPVIHIGGFLALLSKRFEIQPLDDHAIIWNKGESAQDELDDIEDLDEGMDLDTIMEIMEEGMSEPPETDDIDSMMEYMGFHFREGELHAYMLDELFQGGNSLNKVWERCFDDRMSRVPEFRQYEQPLRECLNELWNDIAGSYNRFNDNHRGKIRAQALKITDRQTAWMRSLNEKIDDISELSQSRFAELAETSGMLAQIIVMLNHQDEEFTKKEGRQIAKTLDAFALMIDQMQDNVTL